MPSKDAATADRDLCTGSPQPGSNPAPAAPSFTLSLVLPTYNERENIALILARLEAALQGLSWEAIFVDDDSPDGTAAVVTGFAARDPSLSGCVRLIHRVGRRGLASACMEGMMAAAAPFVAVMDADLQHDEAILPRMLQRIREEGLDVVVGTRNAESGSMGGFCPQRILLSQLGRRLSHAVCRCSLSDPMSGFFIVRRSFFLEVVRDLQCSGFKILVDMLASSRRPVRLAEIGYTFGERRYGESKLDVLTGIEYLSLLINKRFRVGIPVSLILYLLVGSLGLITHLLTLLVLTRLGGVSFVAAQVTSTLVAMIENFFLNNLVTFRASRFRGRHLVTGLSRFVVACSFGAWANTIFARALLQSGVAWYFAGLAGILLGSVWNLSISSLVTWHVARGDLHSRRRDAQQVQDSGLQPGLEVNL